MEQKNNIAELLKDCPSGMELDCTMYDNLYFDSVNAGYYGTINCYTLIDGIKTSINFTKYGTFNNHTGSKCVIFPKGKTTWEGFVPPCKFKDGDVLAEDSCIFIIQKIGDNCTAAKTHCTLYNDGDFDDGSILYFDIDSTKLATEEEKEKLFQAIKDNGYRWNSNTKTLEKLIKPKFKVGDRIKHKETILNIVKVGDNKYVVEDIPSNFGLLTFSSQDDWELVKDNIKIKFKDGDVIYVKSKSILNTELVGIYKKEDNERIYDYCSVSLSRESFYHHNVYGLIQKNIIDISRLATEEEKEKLFQAIKGNGYHWNSETKTLEELVEPKFKVGDKIKLNSGSIIEISEINNYFYISTTGWKFYIKNQDTYELVPNKFDINTLKPFESKVLVRNWKSDYWKPAIFGFTEKNEKFIFYVEGGNFFNKCIPYEGNEHLLGTDDDCDEYYKI